MIKNQKKLIKSIIDNQLRKTIFLYKGFNLYEYISA